MKMSRKVCISTKLEFNRCVVGLNNFSNKNSNTSESPEKKKHQLLEQQQQHPHILDPICGIGIGNQLNGISNGEYIYRYTKPTAINDGKLFTTKERALLFIRQFLLQLLDHELWARWPCANNRC